MPKGIGYGNNDTEKKTEKLGKAQMSGTDKAEKAARKKDKDGKKTTTKKILNFLRQSGPPPAPGNESLIVEE